MSGLYEDLPLADSQFNLVLRMIAEGKIPWRFLPASIVQTTEIPIAKGHGIWRPKHDQTGSNVNVGSGLDIDASDSEDSNKDEEAEDVFSKDEQTEEVSEDEVATTQAPKTSRFAMLSDHEGDEGGPESDELASQGSSAAESMVEIDADATPELIQVLYASETGNAQDAAERVGREIRRRGGKCRVESMERYDLVSGHIEVRFQRTKH